MKLNALSVAQLRRAAALKEKIEALETELSGLLGAAPAIGAGTPSVRNARAEKRAKRPAARARISAAPKRTMSGAARARLSAIAKARWSKTKAAGRNAL